MFFSLNTNLCTSCRSAYRPNRIPSRIKSISIVSHSINKWEFNTGKKQLLFDSIFYAEKLTNKTARDRILLDMMNYCARFILDYATLSLPNAERVKYTRWSWLQLQEHRSRVERTSKERCNDGIQQSNTIQPVNHPCKSCRTRCHVTS